MRCFIFSILLLAAFPFSASVGEEPYQPSQKMTQAVPDIESRLKSGELAQRIAALSLLVQKIPELGKPAILRYELAPKDYEYALNQCFSALGPNISERDGELLLTSAPLWIDIINRFHLTGVTEHVAELLHSESMLLQFFALAVVGEVNARQYELGIAKLTTNKHRAVTRLAREVLLRWKSKELIPLLVEELKDANSFKRFQAMEALESIGDSKGLSALLGCSSDPDENNRWKALKVARGLIPAQDRTRLLVPFAREVARNSSKRDIVDYGLATSIDCGDSEAVTPTLDRLTSTDEGVRGSMQRAMEGMQLTVLAPAVSDALIAKQRYGEAVQNEHIRAGLVDILRRIGTPEVIPALRAAATDPDWYIQSAAISALGQIGAKDAVDDLRIALRGRSARDAAIALCRIRDRRSLSDLATYLQKPGTIDSNFIYHLNEAFSADLDRTLKRTHLSKTIEALPNELLTTLAEEFRLKIKVDVEAKEWMESASRTGKVAVYPNEDVDNSIGRALYYLNRSGQPEYCRILRDGEIHVLRIADAPKFIIEMFEADFR